MSDIQQPTVPDDPGETYRDRLARYTPVWLTYYEPLENSPMVRAWVEALRDARADPAKPSEPEPEPETWRDRPPML